MLGTASRVAERLWSRWILGFDDDGEDGDEGEEFDFDYEELGLLDLSDEYAEYDEWAGM